MIRNQTQATSHALRIIALAAAVMIVAALIFVVVTLIWRGKETLSYTLAEPGQVSAGVFDAAGRQVRPLLYGEPQAAGPHRLHWDGLDRDGNPVPPGDYTVRVLRTPGFTARFVTALGINPGIPISDPAYGRSGRQWAGSHSGVTAMAIDVEGLYLAAGSAEFVPIMLKQSRDGTRRIWERDEFQPSHGAIAIALAYGQLIFLQGNGRAMLANPATGAKTGEWDLKHPDVPRDPKAAYNTGGVVYGVGTIDLAGHGDTLVVSHFQQNLIRWINAEGDVTAEVTVPAPRGVAVAGDGRVLVISENRVLSVAPDGAQSELVNGLTAPLRLTVDPQGSDLLIAEGVPSEQIKRYSADGKLLHTYGRKGGRLDGAYVAKDFRGVTSLVADGQGGFFVAEPSGAPRRVAHFDRAGEVLQEWFGPTGFFTPVAPDPEEPTMVWYSPQAGWLVLAQIDYRQGTWTVRETYHVGGLADGLFRAELGGYTMPSFVRYRDGHRYLVFGTSPPNIALHADGKLQPVVAGGQGGETLERARELAGGGPPSALGFQWHDLNSDGAVQPAEIGFLTESIPSGPKFQASVGEGFSFFTGGPAAVKRLAPKAWHGLVPEYPAAWEQVAQMDNYVGFGFLENANGLFGVLANSRDRHGAHFPTNRVGKVRVVRFGPDGKPVWSVGRHATRDPHDLVNPSLPGEYHEATGFVGALRGAVVVCDRSVRPATVWSDDGLYAGDFLDHRAEDGLPESLYYWWRSPDGIDSILNFDHEVPGQIVECEGKVYWFGNGWQCVPIYEIAGWDGWERLSLPVSVKERAVSAAARGSGLLGRYFANPDFTGEAAMDRVDRQLWFSQGDWYGMQTEVWANGPKGLNQKTGFSARWSGEIEAPLTEDYVFSVDADAKVRLWVDGRQVVWGWNERLSKESSIPIRLEAGKRYAIRLDLSTQAPAPTCSLNWESFSIDRERIPQRYLYPDPDIGKHLVPEAYPVARGINLIDFSVSEGPIDARAARLPLQLPRSENGPVVVGYQGLDFGTGVTRLRASCRTWINGKIPKKVEVRLDGPDGPVLAVLDVPPANTPQEVVVPLSQAVSGVHDLYLINLREGSLQWAEFSELRFE